jgi:ribosome-associated protein
LESNALVEKIVAFMEEKKARDISVIDIRNVTVMADYFVICSGTSTTHIKAIADEIDFKLGELGLTANHREGYDTARWILLDYDDVIIHLFHQEDRDFYNLERLWSDGVMTNYR